MKSYKGQVSIFIIIAIVLIAAGGIAYFFTKNTGESTTDREFFASSEIKPKVDNLISSVQNCMDNSADECIFMIGIQGGYYNKPEDYIDLGWAFIPYYYKDELLAVPGKQDIEGELALCYDGIFPNCLRKIESSEFKISFGKSKTTTELRKGEVEFFVDMPVSIKKDTKSSVFQLNDFTLIRQSKLFEINEVAKYLTDYHKSENKILCLDCAIQMAEERGLNIDFINSGNNIKLIDISDVSNSTVYTFEYAEEYKGGEENVEIPTIPETKL